MSRHGILVHMVMMPHEPIRRARSRLDTLEQTLQNPLYTDDEDDNTIELDEKTAGRVNPQKPVSASQF